MQKIAIIGFGAAGYNAAMEFRKRDAQSQVDIYSDTGISAYNPMLTTYHVKDSIPYRAMFPYGSLKEISQRLCVNIKSDCKVVRLEPEKKAVTTAQGETQVYDQVLIATGASANIPKMEGAGLEGVFTMRTEQDALFLKSRLDSGKVTAGLVFGASWSGIKVVEDFVERDIPVTLMNRSGQAFSKALFPQTAERVQADMAAKGIHMAFGESLAKVDRAENGRLKAITANGKEYEVDLIAVTSGVSPNLDFIKGTSLEVGKGIVVDEHQQSNIPGIYAAGDCCDALNTQSGKKQNIGLWLNSVQQGRIAGMAMAGENARFGANIPVSLAHYLHYDFISLGDAKSVAEEDEIFEYEDDVYYIRAARKGRKIECINVVGAADISGVIKNTFIKTIENPDAKMSVTSICQMKARGLPDNFINFLGGEPFD